MALVLNPTASDLFGFDTEQQESLRKLLTIYNQTNVAPVRISYTEFFGFNTEQAEAITAAFNWSLTSTLPVPGYIFSGVFDMTQRLTLSRIVGFGGQDNSSSGLRRIVLFGDSITAQNGDVSAPLDRWFNNGFFVWANALSGARFFVSNNAGISGNTTTQMLARFSTDVLAYGPQYITIMGGTNDTAGTSATTIANLISMYEQARAAGIYVFAMTVPWRNDGSAPKIADAQTVNAAIAAYWSGRPGGEVVDVYATTLNQPTYFVADGIHPNAIGANAIGTVLAARLATFGTPATFFPEIAGDNYATNPLSKFMTDNPLFAGTGGNLNGSVSGVLPNGVNATSGSTIPTVASKFTADFGEGIQLAGTAGSIGQTVQLNILPIDAFASNRIAVGDTYSVVAVFEIVSGGANLSNFNIGGQVPQPMAASATSVFPSTTPKLKLTTPRVVRDAGTSNAPIAIQLTAAATGAFVVRISQLSIVKH